MTSDEKRKYSKPIVLRKLTYLYKFLTAYNQYVNENRVTLFFLPNAFDEIQPLKQIINQIRYKRKIPSRSLLVDYDRRYRYFKELCDRHHMTNNVVALMEANESAQ